MILQTNQSILKEKINQKNVSLGNYLRDQIVNITGTVNCSQANRITYTYELKAEGAFSVDTARTSPQPTSSGEWITGNLNLNLDTSKVVNTGDRVMPRTLFYNTFIVVSDVYGTLTRDQYNPKPSGEGIWELIDEYDILESIEYLEFKNIDTNYRTRIVIDGLRGGIVSRTQMFCRVACDDIYMETDYYCESSIINSGESYSYVRNKNRANSYQITNDRYSYCGIKTGASANIEFGYTYKLW